VGLRW